jgi:dipeptidyl aminopeptidase/acylaminoacyl peptidase
VLEHVLAADWAPDGQTLAVARDAGERRRLEFPPGKTIYETAGWIDEVHVSPDGRHVAFVDHPERGDNTGHDRRLRHHGRTESDAPRCAERQRDRLAAGWA